jgi:dephospho-CoA kinase
LTFAGEHMATEAAMPRRMGGAEWFGSILTVLYNLVVFSGKPIIGIVGGIGSGKSYIADLFGELGCMVIHSDKLVDEAYNDPAVLQALRQWWGASVFRADGKIDRKAVAVRVFTDSTERGRLEGLLHPMVEHRRRELMAAAANDPQVIAFVWDTPLLVENRLHLQCDAVVFVYAPVETRLARVANRSGWDAAELTRREKLQYPLDMKREISEYVIDNTADAGFARGQVNDVLSRIRGKLA